MDGYIMSGSVDCDKEKKRNKEILKYTVKYT